MLDKSTTALAWWSIALTAATATAGVLAYLYPDQRTLFLVFAVICFIISLYSAYQALGLSLPYRRWRQRRRDRRIQAVHAAKQSASRPVFEERFAGWPEFSQQTTLMLKIIAAEEDRMQGHARDDVPSWPAFMRAANAAHVAAGSLWEGYRQGALEATAPAVKLREPITYRVAHEATAELRRFRQERDREMGELSREAGIDTQDYVRRLKGDS